MAKQVNKVTKVKARSKAKAAVETMDLGKKGEGKDAQAKSGARINAVLNEIAVTSKQLHDKVALCAALIVIHATVYRDVTPASRLIEKMGPGMRGNTLREWFEVKGPFTWGDTKGKDTKGAAIKGFKLNVKKCDEMAATLKNAEAVRKLGSDLQKNSFWEWKKEPEYKPFDMVAVIEAALKQGDKRLNKKDPRDNVIGIEVFREALTKAKIERDKKMVAAGAITEEDAAKTA